MDRVPYYSSRSGQPLSLDGCDLIDQVTGLRFPIVDHIPRFVASDNYSSSFGFQWSRFDKTQIDGYSGAEQSRRRLVAETNWCERDLNNCNILEVGSGAGRFTRELLKLCDSAQVYSVDYSLAVTANYASNACYGSRLKLSQASIYELPFKDCSFDKVICLGVLQHTPDFERSVKCLIEMAKPGGEIVVDFYPIKGWYTKLHAKYLLRPFTKRLRHQSLLNLISNNIDWLMWCFDALVFLRLGVLTRFLPLTDLRNFPRDLNKDQRKEWAILDTFDAFAPAYDNPRRLSDVVSMFSNGGCEISFAGLVDHGDGKAMVVRGIKR